MDDSIRLLERAELPPAKCAITGDIDGPFIDTNVTANPSDLSLNYRIYLHAPWVEQVARDLLNMVPESEVKDLRGRLDAYGDEMDALREQLAALKILKDAEDKLAAVA